MECGWCWHVNVGSLMPHIHVPFWCWGRARVGRDVWEIPVPSSRFYYELKSTLKIIFIKGGGVAGRGGGGGSCLEGFPVKIWLYLTPSLAQGLMGPCIYAVYAYIPYSLSNGGRNGLTIEKTTVPSPAYNRCNHCKNKQTKNNCILRTSFGIMNELT